MIFGSFCNHKFTVLILSDWWKGISRLKGDDSFIQLGLIINFTRLIKCLRYYHQWISNYIMILSLLFEKSTSSPRNYSSPHWIIRSIIINLIIFHNCSSPACKLFTIRNVLFDVDEARISFIFFKLFLTCIIRVSVILRILRRI